MPGIRRMPNLEYEYNIYAAEKSIPPEILLAFSTKYAILC